MNSTFRGVPMARSARRSSINWLADALSPRLPRRAVASDWIPPTLCVARPKDEKTKMTCRPLLPFSLRGPCVRLLCSPGDNANDAAG